jgi:hypothetical protein
MFVGDFLDYEAATGRFFTQTADGHAAVRKAKLDCVF